MMKIYITFGVFVVSAILTIFGIIATIKEEKKRGPVIAFLIGFIGLVGSLASFDIPAATIYPLDNDIIRYAPIDVLMVSEQNLEIYYTLDGTDPKEGLPYVGAINIADSATISARTRYLGVFWSEISKSHFQISLDKASTPAMKNTEFVKDYRTGYDNEYGNLEYFNNGALLCEQDGMFYISAENAIYKTKDFQSFIHIVDGDVIGDICVLGDWMYYSSDRSICKVKTDGSQKETLYETSRGVIRMNAKGDWLYFVSNEDGLMYKIIKNGEGLSQVTDIPVSNFILIDDYLYFISGTFEKTYDTGYSMNNEGFYKLNLYSNELSSIALPEYMGNEVLLGDIQFYDGVFYIFANGLQRFDLISDKYTLIDEKHFDKTCIIDNKIYYIDRMEGEFSSFNYYDLDLKRHIKIAYPYQNNNYISWFYPTEHGFIYAHEYADWNIMSLDGARSSFLLIQ